MAPACFRLLPAWRRPSGGRCRLLSKAPSLRRHSFLIELDWISLSLVAFVDGRPFSNAPISFAPHANVPADEKQAMRSRLARGWQHLYLFTWLEDVRDDLEDDAPEVEVGPIWLENETASHKRAPETANEFTWPDLSGIESTLSHTHTA
mmetsp:Transcript_1833/g.4840  ORF Transcript_1833/g.4840 Transcript_1833/m.4840 type:complete len:149 (+) Transcript_1833:1-447(+)